MSRKTMVERKSGTHSSRVNVELTPALLMLEPDKRSSRLWCSATISRPFMKAATEVGSGGKPPLEIMDIYYLLYNLINLLLIVFPLDRIKSVAKNRNRGRIMEGIFPCS